MLLDIVLGNKAVWRILILLSESTGSAITRPEIRRFTKLGNKSISSVLEILLANNLLIKHKEGKKTYYKLNLTNEFIKGVIDLCKNENKHLNSLPYSFSLVLREFTRQLIALIDVKKIILFGSVAKRTFREDSDIDIAVITDDEVKMREKLSITKIVDDLENRFKKLIQPHYFTTDEFGKAKNKVMDEIKRDGIKLL